MTIAKMCDDYSKCIAESQFYELINEHDVNGATTLWTNIVSKLCDKHLPWKEVTLKSETEEVPWFNGEVYQLKEERKRALSDYRAHSCEKTKLALRIISNKLKNLKSLGLTL